MKGRAFKSGQFSPGKNHIHWCRECNLLLIEDKCGLCGRAGAVIFLSPPGDIRPAPKEGVRLIKSIFEDDFGTGSFLDGRLVFLNKISGLDRREQIIVDSRNIATLEFSLLDMSYRIELNIDGALLLAGISDRKTVVIDPRAVSGRHLKGKRLNGNAVLKMSGDIKPGDSVIVRIGDSTGVGVALTSPLGFDPGKPAVRVRDVSGRKNLRFHDKKPGLGELMRANAPALKKMETAKVREIRDAVRIARSGRPAGGIPLSVSFSGGKDSLAALALTEKASEKFDVVFVDTGLEFPETVRYVVDYCKKAGLKLLRADAGTAFWDNIGKFGPPGKDYRWCCKTCKLAPLAALIGREYPRGVITVEGNRIYESFSRADLRLTTENPFVPNQFIINPIRDWRALEVWLYIHWKRLSYNPLYDEDFERIGCWLCPASLGSEFETLGRTHPELYGKWLGRLREWVSENGLPKEYATHGFWRWKKLPPKMLGLAREMGLDVLPSKEVPAKSVSFSAVGGISPCITGGYSLEGVLKSPFSPELDTVAAFMGMLGKTRLSEDFGVVLVDLGKGAGAKLFAGGQFVVTAERDKGLEALFGNVLKQLLRAHLCASCGICERACPRKAIKIRERVVVDTAKCSRCLKCMEGCVAAKYGEKLLRSGAISYTRR
jgi:phosphoadenosine phosphosulfate reductase